MNNTFSSVLNRSPMGRFQWLTMFVCMLILVCDGIDMQLLGIVAPLVMQDFTLDRSVFGFAMGAALVGFGLGGWGGGWLGDRIGRRMILPIAAAIFSLATIGAGVSNDVWQLAGWRLLGGIGFGAAYANSLALASEWAPDRLRPRYCKHAVGRRADRGGNCRLDRSRNCRSKWLARCFHDAWHSDACYGRHNFSGPS